MLNPIRVGVVVESGNRRKIQDRAYIPPANVEKTTLQALLAGVRAIPPEQQTRLGISDEAHQGMPLWIAGDKSLVQRSCVAIVGARRVSAEGAARARRLGRELAQAGIVVVSGLARGVDTEALTSATHGGGRVVAVIGTPLDKAYPAENKRLQEHIYREHLLVSQFAPGKKAFPSNFPERNKLMAAISDATVIIEASDTSGSLHQAAESVRLNRWLFIAKSVMDDQRLKWPRDFAKYPRTRVLTSSSDVLQAIGIPLCPSR